MISRRHPTAIAAVTIAVATALAGHVVDAAASEPRRCSGGFERGPTGHIATARCDDHVVVEVARTYGVTTTASEVRDDPLVTRDLCRMAPRDTRLRGPCFEAWSNDRGD
jgi:hypothetical protein